MPGAGVPAELAAKLADLKPDLTAPPSPQFLQDPDSTSLRPYELSARLRPIVERLGMQQNLADMEEKGYTVLTGCFSPDECERLCAVVRRHGPGLRLLDKDEAFEAVVVQEKLVALAEYMCGAGCVLSQVAASTLDARGTARNRGAGGLPKAGMHSDQFWTPAPFPEHNQLLTCCVTVGGDFTLENGATCVVPGSHKLRRHPNRVEVQNCQRLVTPVHCKRGDAVCWDGAVWHTGGVRQAPGQRVAFHVTYCRRYAQPIWNYDNIPDARFAGKPYAALLARLLGRGENGGMLNEKGGEFNSVQFQRLAEMGRGTYDRAGFDKKVEGLLSVVEARLRSGKVKVKDRAGLERFIATSKPPPADARPRL